MEPKNNECATHRQFEPSCVVCQLMSSREEQEALRSALAGLYQAAIDVEWLIVDNAHIERERLWGAIDDAAKALGR